MKLSEKRRNHIRFLIISRVNNKNLFKILTRILEMILVATHASVMVY